jgi:hypothetical protein
MTGYIGFGLAQRAQCQDRGQALDMAPDQEPELGLESGDEAHLARSSHGVP